LYTGWEGSQPTDTSLAIGSRTVAGLLQRDCTIAKESRTGRIRNVENLALSFHKIHHKIPQNRVAPFFLQQPAA